MLQRAEELRHEAAVIVKIHHLLEGLSVESRRRIAYDIWRTHGGSPGGSNEPPGEVQIGSNEPAETVQNGSNAPVESVQKGGRLEGGFLQFWALYPRKTGKQEARRIWLRLKPNAELQDRILRAVREQKTSEQWNKDGGQFIPHPKTWLNQGRWDDEPVQCTGLKHATDVSGLVAFAEKEPVHGPTGPKAIRG